MACMAMYCIGSRHTTNRCCAEGGWSGYQLAKVPDLDILAGTGGAHRCPSVPAVTVLVFSCVVCVCFSCFLVCVVL